jgi:hypothetical protein
MPNYVIERQIPGAGAFTAEQLRGVMIREHAVKGPAAAART